MVAPERAAILKREAWAAVERARTLNAAARDLANVFRTEYPNLIRLAVRSYDSDANTIRIVGLWSEGETAVGVGVTTSATATSMPEVLRTSRPVFEEDANAHYLEEILRSEGIRSWITIPLRAGDAVHGMLSLSSKEPHAFPHEDEPFLTEVGALLEERLFELAETSRG